MNNYLPGPNLGGSALLRTISVCSCFRGLLICSNGTSTTGASSDQKISSKNTAFFRYQVSISNYVLAGNYPAFTWTRLRNSPNFVAADTHVFSPTLLNEFKFGFYRPNYLDGGTVGE